MIRLRLVKHVTVVGAFLVALTAAGCGADEPPAVCSSVDALGSSIEDVTAVELSEGVLEELGDNLRQVRSDLDEVREEAADEYSDEVDAVEQAVASVGASVETGITSPSSDALTEVGTGLEALGSSLSVLKDAVAGSC